MSQVAAVCRRRPDRRHWQRDRPHESIKGQIKGREGRQVAELGRDGSGELVASKGGDKDSGGTVTQKEG